jgi:hypothetical protein
LIDRIDPLCLPRRKISFRNITLLKAAKRSHLRGGLGFFLVHVWNAMASKRSTPKPKETIQIAAAKSLIAKYDELLKLREAVEHAKRSADAQDTPPKRR